MTCAWVAVGGDAWDFARRKAFPVMVLPPGEDPFSYRWPVRDLSVVLVEWGSHDTVLFERTALALLQAGATIIRGIRQGTLGDQRVTEMASFAQSARHAA